MTAIAYNRASEWGVNAGQVTDFDGSFLIDVHHSTS